MSTFGSSSANSFLADVERTALSSIMLAVHETPAIPYPKPRLLDRVRDAIRPRYYSRETEKAYVEAVCAQHQVDLNRGAGWVAVGWTADGGGTAIEDVRVNHGCRNITVA